MFAGNKNLLRIFAPVSLGFVLIAVTPAQAKTSSEAGEPTASVKRQSAAAQLARADEQRAALNAKPSDKRTLADYKQVVASYRRVALITPRAPEVPDSLLAVAELYTEMGDRFGRSYYQSAVDSYQFLVREYPANKHCQDAILRIAKLQRDQLAGVSQAQRTYEEFLKRYPRSPRKREAEEALAELALVQTWQEAAAKNEARGDAASARTVAAEEPRPNVFVHSGGKSVAPSNPAEIPRVRRIRASLNGDATRVTIDLENSVEFASGKIANPERIFFDLHGARLTPEVARDSIHVEGDLLAAVRVAQNHAGVVRVVLDVNGVKDYNATLINNPPQLVIDLYGNSFGAEPAQTASAKRPQKVVAEDPSKNETAASSGARQGQTVAAKNSGDPPAAASDAPPAANSKTVVTGTLDRSSAEASSTPSPRNALPSAKNGKSKSLKSGSPSEKPDLIRPASIPQPTRDGQSTLTRTLGLKIGRIVIDPGHGGHDTGTIGPTGLMEKDLCLDVALRLGKIIEQRLPGADVIYTRSDDTFVPLEERTNIANQAKADLFISIHANSSRDSGARGIETYYLTLKGSAEAMEVAARENATAQEGVHDLENLVKKIAQTEKIDESKEFAEDIQESLSKRMLHAGKSVKNRGVRKAPFVVLIGADMPSILTEISFLSNPADEKLLKQPEQRQKVAEGLFQGISSYLENMNSMTVNLPPKSGQRRPASSVSRVAAVEQSRNQR
jgi:N-acetylmuramoyl-L-alanine amidase